MGNIVGERLWEERENQRTRTQVRPSEIRVGEHYEYRGANTITRDATYEVEIIKITDYIVVMDIVIDQSLSQIERYGKPRSYSFAIQRQDIGRTERFYRRTR